MESDELTRRVRELEAALEDSAAERERMRHSAAEAARVLEVARQQFRDAAAEREAIKAEWAALQTTTAWKLTAMIRGVQKFATRQKRSFGKRRRDAAHRILRWAAEWHPTESLRELHEFAELIRASGLLDAPWYKTQYADRVGGKMDVALHYLRHGVSQGCDPNPFFDTRWYLEKNRDAVGAANPLVHYLTHGWKEGRDPSPLFSIAACLRENPALSGTGSEPLVDYLARRRKNPATTAPTARLRAETGAAATVREVPAVVAGARPRICFIGHAGLLHLVGWLKANTNLDFRVVLLGDASQSSQFSELAPTLVSQNVSAAEVLNFCDQRIDLIYGHASVPESLAALGIPIVTDMHDWEPPEVVSAIRSALAAAKRDRFSKTPATLSVSVVVPNYNYARYLDQRLASIEAQTHPIHEIIVLDDASQDDSAEVVRLRMRASDTPMMFVANPENSGSVSAQWSKGLELASGELVWIAEADDYCEPVFLARLAATFRDPEVVLAYSQSLPVDAEGKVLIQGFGRTSKRDEARMATPGLVYTDTLDSRRWETDYVTSGDEEIARALSQQNTIPNASAVLLRRRAAIEAVPAALEFKNCGDWAFYLELARRGKIAYIRANLNYFRRHDASTTVNQSARLIAEGLAIKRRLIDEGRLSGNPLLESLCRSFVEYEGEMRHDPERVPMDRHPTCLPELARLKESLDRVLPAAKRPSLLVILPDAETGGGQTAAIRLANRLARDHRVFLLSARPDLDDGNVKQTIAPEVLLLEGRLDARIHRRFGGAPRPLWAIDANPMRVAALAGLMRLLGIEVVLSNVWWADRLAFALTELTPVPWFIHLHGCHEFFLECHETDPDFRTLAPQMMRRAAGVFYLHPKNLEVFADLEIPRPPVHRITCLVPNPAPMSASSVPPFPKREGDFVFCLCARALPEKGWEEAIRATLAVNRMPAAERGNRTARLVLIGDGPRLAEILARHPEREHLSPLGLHPQPVDVMAYCDAALLPTRCVSESQPNVVVEYLSCGLPVIATDHAGIPEMIADGDLTAGLLIPLGNADAITAALIEGMTQLLRDPALCARLRTAARTLFERNFDAQACLQRVEGKILSALETNR